MVTLRKKEHEHLIKELVTRQEALGELLQGRPLKSASEGCKRGCWVAPLERCALKGSSVEIRMALEDFKTVLKEIERATR